MDGVAFKDYVFKMANQAVLMKDKTNASGQSKTIDPLLLSKRLLVVQRKLKLSETDVFTYELCSHPTSLFESSGLMRSPDKPELSNAIEKHVISIH